MKFILIILLFIGFGASAQTVGQFRYDTTKFNKIGGFNEVKIQNATQDTVGGIFTNVGKGWGKWLRPRAVPGGILIGTDTILVAGGGPGGGRVDSCTSSNDSLYYWVGGIRALFYVGGGGGGSSTPDTILVDNRYATVTVLAPHKDTFNFNKLADTLALINAQSQANYNAIQQRVRFSDTAAMLFPYAQKSSLIGYNFTGLLNGDLLRYNSTGNYFENFTPAYVTLTGTQSLTNKTINGVTPTTVGSATTYLNGAGSYTTPAGGGGGGTPGGTNGSIQFNKLGAFYGSSFLVWDTLAKQLAISNMLNTGSALYTSVNDAGVIAGFGTYGSTALRFANSGILYSTDNLNIVAGAGSGSIGNISFKTKFTNPDAMRIFQNGAVGIGQTLDSTAGKLILKGILWVSDSTNAEQYSGIENKSTGTSALTRFYVKNNAGYKGYLTIAGSNAASGANDVSLTGSKNLILNSDASVASGGVSTVTINTGGYSSPNKITILGSGNMGLKGVTSPTARLHLPAGTAAASTSPLKFTAGTVLTTPESGVLETDVNNSLWYTSASLNRFFVSMDGYIAKTATYTATFADYTIDCTANTFTVTLPSAGGIFGRKYIVTNSGAGTITIATSLSQTFTNVTATPTSLTMSTVGSRVMQSTGTGWILLSSL